MPSLTIDVEARFAQFQDSLDKIAKQGEQAAGRVGTAFDGLKTTLAGIGLASAGAFVFGGLRTTIDELDSFNDAADKSGSSIEALSGLLNTLKPYGATLEEIADLSGKVIRAMQGADEETSAAARAFDALGVKTRDAAGNLRPWEEVLRETSAALGQFEDSSNKVALVQAILGKSGAQYLPLLKDLNGAQREAATVTSDQAAAAETLNKAMATLSAEVGKLRVEAFGPLVTKLAEVADKFRAAKNAGLDFWAAARNAGGAKPQDEAANIARLRDQNIKELDAFAREFGEYASGARMPREGRVDRLRELINDRGRAIAEYNAQIQKLQALAGAGEAAVSGQSSAPPRSAPALPPKPETPKAAAKPERADLTPEQKALIDAFEAVTKADRAAAELAKKIELLDALFFAGAASAESYDAAVAEAFRTTETVGKGDPALKALAEKWKDAIDPVRKYVRELEEVRDLLARGELTPDEALEAEFNIQLKIDDAVLKKLPEDVQKAKSAADELGLTFTSAFEDAVVSGRKFGEVLQSLAQDILKLFVRKSITEPLTSGLSAGFSSLLGGTGFFDAFLKGISGRASGGPVTAGVPYIVGERGPELIVPKAAGTVIPNFQLGRGGGGVSVVQNISVASGATRAEVLQAMAIAKDQAKAEIYESMRRGGVFA